MKISLLSSVILGLTMLLTAWGGGWSGTAPKPSKVALTTNATGVPRAPVKVADTISKATVFDGSITGSKIFGNLTANSMLSVVGSAVDSKNASGPRMDSEKVVALAHTASTGAGTPVSQSLTSGKVLDTDLKGDGTWTSQSAYS